MAKAQHSSWTRMHTAIVIALAAHAAILLLLSMQWSKGERRFDNPPMEVDLIADVAPESTAPIISDTAPAAKLGEPDASDSPPPEPDPAPPQPTPPTPVTTPAPTPPKVTPPPKQVRNPAPPPPKKVTPPAKTPPAKTPPAKAPPPKTVAKGPPAKNPPAKTNPQNPTKSGSRGPTGRLDGIVDGLAKDRPRNPAAKGAPAAVVSAQVKKSIDVSIKAKVGPRWSRCNISGVDVEELKTEVKFRLTQSGALAGFTSVRTTGQNDSNRPQVARHQECAKKAIELAAPFDLPEENFAFWQNYTLDFDKAR